MCTIKLFRHSYFCILIFSILNRTAFLYHLSTVRGFGVSLTKKIVYGDLKGPQKYMWANNIKLKSKSKTKKDYHYNPEASNHGLCKDLRFTQRTNLELRVMTFYSFRIVF